MAMTNLMNDKKFAAPADNFVRLISNLSIIICLVLLFFVITSGFGSFSILFFVFSAVLLITWCFHPQYYILNDEGLKIKWPVGRLFIPYQNMVKAGSLTKSDLGYCLRLFCCDGLFGYFGLYLSKKMGRFSMWCTNKKDMVAIMAEKTRIVIISPSETSVFLDILNARLHRNNNTFINKELPPEKGH